ncbi:MAG: hypothetical protein RR145_05090, partial [Oscillospiraceae bacterium]
MKKYLSIIVSLSLILSIFGCLPIFAEVEEVQEKVEEVQEKAAEAKWVCVDTVEFNSLTSDRYKIINTAGCDITADANGLKIKANATTAVPQIDFAFKNSLGDGTYYVEFEYIENLGEKAQVWQTYRGKKTAGGLGEGITFPIGKSGPSLALRTQADIDKGTATGT